MPDLPVDAALKGRDTVTLAQRDVQLGAGGDFDDVARGAATQATLEAVRVLLAAEDFASEAKLEAVRVLLAAGFANIPDETGTWSYRAGVSGSVTVPAGGRVIGIAAHAATAGSFSINGGDSIPVPANVGADLAPRAALIAPTVVFSGTDAYVLEFVT